MLRIVNVFLSFTVSAGVLACCCPCGRIPVGGPPVQINVPIQPPPVAKGDAQPVDGKNNEDKKKTDKGNDDAKKAGGGEMNWQTVNGKDEDLEFTLRIPPEWKWKSTGQLHEAVRHTGLTWNQSFAVVPDRLTASRKKLSPADFLKHARNLATLGNPSLTIVEQRTIKIGDLNAAWIVGHEKAVGQTVITKLETFCRMRGI